MAAPTGNRFWEARTKHGRDLLFKTPEILWEACCEYFAWIDANPLQEEKGFAFQGEVTRASFGKMRAMTLSGLCLFLDIDDSTWREYSKREDFSGVCTRAEKIIYNQKFQGAAADLLNANIIARELGLAEKKEHSGPDGGAIEVSDLSEREIARRIAYALSKATNGADA